MKIEIYVCDMCHKVMTTYYGNTFTQYCEQCCHKLQCDMQLRTFTTDTEKSSETEKEEN